MRIFKVGGCVRDTLLGMNPKDIDWVVVGSTPEEMLEQGYTKVGADFPVFLKDGQEFALARRERKTGPGYHGFETEFDSSVTLEEDLSRRDLTINAMAEDEEGNIIDPFGGRDDLKKGVLRHVSDAFAEDPVRVLRVARFAARYNFEIAPETMTLMTKLVINGELDHLTPERVWKELSRALMEFHPMDFFWTLNKCGALDKLFPWLGRSMIFAGGALSKAAMFNAPLEQRMMLMCGGVDLPGDKLKTVLSALCVPAHIQKMCVKFIIAKKGITFHANKMIPSTILLRTLNDIDAFRQPEDVFEVAHALSYVHSIVPVHLEMLMWAFGVARRINFMHLTEEQRTTLKGKAIGEAIDVVRLQAVVETFHI